MKKILPILIAFILNINTSIAQEEVVLELQPETPYAVSVSDNNLETPDFELLKNLVQELDCPIILEGRIWNVEEVDKAFDLGAHSVVIGSAITRPQLITKRFCERG